MNLSSCYNCTCKIGFWTKTSINLLLKERASLSLEDLIRDIAETVTLNAEINKIYKAQLHTTGSKSINADKRKEEFWENKGWNLKDTKRSGLLGLTYTDIKIYLKRSSHLNPHWDAVWATRDHSCEKWEYWDSAGPPVGITDVITRALYKYNIVVVIIITVSLCFNWTWNFHFSHLKQASVAL